MQYVHRINTPTGFVVAVLALALALISAPVTAQDDGAAVVVVDHVIVEPRFQTQPVVGRLVARQSSVVAAQVVGAVASVYVEIGDRVAAGQLLAELDVRRIELNLQLARAELAEREARLIATEATVSLYSHELSRMEGLRGSAAFSQARFEDAVAEVNRSVGERSEAEASVARARAAIERAEIDREDAAIRAPISGVVTDRDIYVGEHVDVGDPVLTLVNDRDLEIEAAVPAGLVVGLYEGREVEAILDDGTGFAATTRALIPLEDTRTRTRLVRMTPQFPETDRPLAADQSVVVSIPIGVPTDVVTVHKDAIVSDPVVTGQVDPVVFQVVDGAAAMTPVELGPAIGDRFEVIAGLAAGDIVVVRGNEGLYHTQPVQYEGF